MQQLNIVGAVVTKTGVTLYTDDGEVKNLNQTDFRTADILDTVLIGLMKSGAAKIELGSYSLATKIAEATNGAVVVSETHEGTVLTAGEHKIVAVNGEVEGLLKHVADGAGSAGLAKFIENFAMIPRQHSQKELLDFIAKHDLPIADDGTLIVYKRVQALKGDCETFVDCHTGRVKQRLGSVVLMPDSRVDADRSRECSYGYHVASQSYIKSFSGDTLLICKVKPQNVIAVPRDYGSSKMRCSEYFIVAVAPEELLKEVSYDRPFNKTEAGAALIGRIVAGQHTQPVEFVEEMDVGGLKITPIVREDRKSFEQPAKKAKSKPVFAKEKKEDAKAVSPKSIKEWSKAFKADEKPVKLSATQKAYAKKVEKARKLWDGGKGMSIRAICAKLGVDRDSLTKHLKQA
jgi:hypothetical protein